MALSYPPKTAANLGRPIPVQPIPRVLHQDEELTAFATVATTAEEQGSHGPEDEGRGEHREGGPEVGARSVLGKNVLARTVANAP
jgi:hypothetical protein